jgi:predicted transcriptional regulator
MYCQLETTASSMRLYNTLQACIYSENVYYRLRKMKNRSRTELASYILEAANGGATKTKIMYKAYLSYAQLKEYLAVLIENGLMTRDVDGDLSIERQARGSSLLGLQGNSAGCSK